MEPEQQYHLVHMTTGYEYKTPLVASQLFDQAEWQANNREKGAPQSVHAWVIGAFRQYYVKEEQQKLQSLQTRCPHVNISMINGISRLGNFPIMPMLKMKRRALGKMPVIYHCRGEKVARWAIELRKSFPQDKVVLDVRGYWPAEKIYDRGITDPATATGKDLFDYKEAYDYLKSIVAQVDAVTTVSAALRDMLIKEMNAPADTYVVPCCIAAITDESKRDAIRAEWGLKTGEVALVYSGTTAGYQHLEDLTIPFMKKLSEINNNVRLIFLSSEHEKIKKMLADANVNMDRVVVRSYKQNEVGFALTACDAGILIRKPTLVNRVANPVKIAEYMGAGLPIIIERGVGGVEDVLFDRQLLKGIQIAEGGSMDAAAASVDEWIGSGLAAKRKDIKEYVKGTYLWSSAIHVSRRMYNGALNNKNKN